jgi:glyoxylase-like metal-dependent hydrolase (beta-lactamase superfamily II)
MGMNVVHLRTPDASILVDPGWGPPTTKPTPERGITRSPGVAAGLASLGVRPEDVTHVVISHAHWDHFTGGTIERGGRLAPRYPNARYLLGRADWEGNPARDQPGSAHALHLGALERAGVLDLVDGDREIAPGVTMLHTPGESPGHSIVRLRSGSETFYYLGDLFHHPCELERLEWVFKRRDVPATIASRRRFLAEAVPSRALLVCTHRPFPGWFRIVAAGDGYRWQEPA